MSIYLSRDFAKTHKRLEQKLIEVKQLSERSLKQERLNKKKEIEAKEGDTFLLMSDGLMELFNDQREQLGLDRIKRTFKEAAGSSASDIMSQITKLIDQWSGTKSQEDDITIWVMKAT